MVHILDDLLTGKLKLVICGTAASHRSAALGHYYAGPGNRFWQILTQVGLTPRQLTPAEYHLLPTFGIGLTDIAKSQSGADTEVRFATEERRHLRNKIEAFQPAYLCFNGKRAAKEYFGVPELSFGLQSEVIGTTRIFVAPSTSAAARRSWDPDLWQQLADHVLGAKAAT